MMKSQELVRILGIPGNYVGYKQLVFAIDLAVEDEDRLLHIYRDLYTVVAEKFNTSAKNVEKNIRTAIRAAWQRNDNTRTQFEMMAGYCFSYIPGTSEFLDIVCGFLHRDIE